MNQPVQSTAAWLLQYAPKQFVAIGIHLVQEILYNAELFSLPFAPKHCCNLFYWDNSLVPLFDLNQFINDQDNKHDEIIVIAFEQANQIAYGSLSLLSKPKLIQVNDSQHCQLPTSSSIWKHISLSCFLHGESKVPILDVAKLFSPNTLQRNRKQIEQ